jgi:pyruvate,water dikinase
MTRLIARLLELARIAKGDRVLERLLQEGRFHDLETPSLGRRHSVKLFQQRFGQMQRVYGARAGHGFGSRTDFFTEPTWNMDPSRALDLIASYTEQDLDRLESIEQEARAERLRMIRQYRAQLSDAPEELARFDEGLGKAHRHVVFIEDHNHYMEQLTVGALREAMHNVGSELARRDLVEAPDDVFHLSLDELRQIAGSKNPADQSQLVQQRAKEHDRRKLLKPPERLGAKPKKVKRKKMNEDDRGRRGRTIKGVGASRGRGEGRAVVLSDDRPRLHPGDILVATNVGPDWTPSFAFIGGLVLDEGALSQHAAIVAREYGVPAVMQTKEATKFIRSGQTIIVDGDRGVVELGDGTW